MGMGGRGEEATPLKLAGLFQKKKKRIARASSITSFLICEVRLHLIYIAVGTEGCVHPKSMMVHPINNYKCQKLQF